MAKETAEKVSPHTCAYSRGKEVNSYVWMRMVSRVWFLVDISPHHDRDDRLLFLHDEKARDGLLDGLLPKRQVSLKRGR